MMLTCKAQKKGIGIMEKRQVSHKYDDIINLPHHRSDKRPKMPLCDRAAQFSPFAALTGYDEAIKESARLTEQRRELSDEKKNELNAKLSLLRIKNRSRTEVNIIYFIPDQKKDGGAYTSVTGAVRRIDDCRRIIIMENQQKIPLDDIWDISGQVFREMETEVEQL